MYFSKILLNSSRIHYDKIFYRLSDEYGVHQLIWELFEKQEEQNRDFLFHKIVESKMPAYYVLSERKPLLGNIWEIETKEYHPIIKQGRVFSFLLRVNPVITKRTGPERKHTRKDIVISYANKYPEKINDDRVNFSEVLQITGDEWIKNKGMKNGFEVTSKTLYVENYRHIKFYKRKKGKPIQLTMVDFRGLLHVTDSELFNRALRKGIGPAKAFGCGMLLIKPANGALS